VTGAAGAVGSIAAQLAKSTGARVVGIAGGKPKQAFLLDNLKLDGAVDYKDAERNLAHQLDECCPDGIDFVYDNVGGETLDALLERINPNGRVVICGAISQYSGNLNKGKVQGPSNYLKLAERGAEMKGFNVMQHMYKIPLMLFGMFWLYMRGKVHMTEHIENGIESFPLALQKLFTGGHIGKMLVNVKLSC
jgi:NADPH-dependent curcumin reductase CurA